MGQTVACPHCGRRFAAADPASRVPLLQHELPVLERANLLLRMVETLDDLSGIGGSVRLSFPVEPTFMQRDTAANQASQSRNIDVDDELRRRVVHFRRTRGRSGACD